MPTDPAPCPGCGNLMQVSASHGVRYECPGCHGRVLGLSPFEQMLQDGVGPKVWVASSDGEPGALCPFCANHMRQPAADAGAPAGLAVCRTCQQVWIPASASDWMAANAAPNVTPDAAVAAAQPTECSNCGAPFQPDDLGQCHYCHAQITAPTPIVFEVAPTSVHTGLAASGGLLGALASVLTTPLD